MNTIKLVKFYNGADGLKTGYTSEAGYCLTATAKRENMRIIAVVMGEPDSTTRTLDVSAMLDYAFAQYSIETFLSTSSILDTIVDDKVDGGYINVVPKENVTILNKKLENKKNASYELRIDKFNYPISKGESIGKLSVFVDDNLYREIDVTVSDDVSRASLVKLYLKYFKKILTGNIVF